MRKDLPVDEICDLYLNKEMSSTKIARRYRCCKATVLKILKKRRIKRRPAGVPRIETGNDELKRLYLDKKLSTRRIAEVIGCGRSTVHRKLMKMGVTRDISTSHIRYPRKAFSGDLGEKAYLTGFAIGDLRVRKVGKKSRTIKIDCGSTKKEQIDLIHSLFSKYGRVWISRPTTKGRIQIEAFVGTSFGFLLDCRDNLEWIFSGRYFLPFFAGFTDAEGSIFITNRKAAYSVGNYDHELLQRIRKKLLEYGIEMRMYQNKRRYQIAGGYMQKHRYWILTLHRKKELLKLFNILSPHIRHKKRRNDIQKAIDHISKR